MSNVTVSQVQALNKRIEEINRKRTKVETQEEMLRGRLEDEIKEYAREFGVNLSAKTLSAIKRLVQQESDKVYSEVQKEYELKEKVVALIDQGDIKEANRLLGVEPQEETEDIAEEIDNLIDEAVEEAVNEELAFHNTYIDEEIPIDDFDSMDFEEEENKGMSPMSTIFGDLEVEDDDDEDTSFADDSDEESFSSDDLVVEDDDDEDFGFGEMLHNSKFEV